MKGRKLGLKGEIGGLSTKARDSQEERRRGEGLEIAMNIEAMFEKHKTNPTPPIVVI